MKTFSWMQRYLDLPNFASCSTLLARVWTLKCYLLAKFRPSWNCNRKNFSHHVLCNKSTGNRPTHINGILQTEETLWRRLDSRPPSQLPMAWKIQPPFSPAWTIFYAFWKLEVRAPCIHVIFLKNDASWKLESIFREIE